MTTPSPRPAQVHPAGPVPADRSDLAEAGRVLLRSVLPAAVFLCLALAVYGGTGHSSTAAGSTERSSIRPASARSDRSVGTGPAGWTPGGGAGEGVVTVEPPHLRSRPVRR